MKWYNPLELFRKEAPDQQDLTLQCDNPQCGAEITENPVAYAKECREVYHPGDCPQIAAAHKVMKTGECIFVNLDYMSLDKAIKLLKKGKLNQSSNLEEKAE
jgi:hypothetical protein